MFVKQNRSKKGGAGGEQGRDCKTIKEESRTTAPPPIHLGRLSLLQGSCTNATLSLLPKANTHTIIHIEQTHGNPCHKKEVSTQNVVLCFASSLLQMFHVLLLSCCLKKKNSCYG